MLLQLKCRNYLNYLHTVKTYPIYIVLRRKPDQFKQYNFHGSTYDIISQYSLTIPKQHVITESSYHSVDGHGFTKTQGH